MMSECLHGVDLVFSCPECLRQRPPTGNWRPHGGRIMRSELAMGCPICNAGLLRDGEMFSCVECGWSHVPLPVQTKFHSTGESFSIQQPPAFVGGWVIGGIWGLRVATINRPSWLHRTMARILLGWEWEKNS